MIWPSLNKSREAFSATLVAANAYYLSLASDAAEDAYRNIATIERTIPVMVDLADNDLQRNALAALASRVVAMRTGLNNLADNFAAQSRLLRDAIDGNQAAIVATIDRLSDQVRAREQAAQEHFDEALDDVFLQVTLIAIAFLVLIVAIGVAIASSIIGAAAGTADRDACDRRRRLRQAGARESRRATRSARWRARSRCSAKTPSPSAVPKGSCAPPRTAPRARSPICARPRKA